MSPMFTFDPLDHAPAFAARDYVHIPRGLSEEYYAILCRQVDAYLTSNRLKNFAIGNKQQALYEFPAEGDYHGEFLRMVGAVCGLDPAKLVIAERHIKAYEADAQPYPPAHKDRFATQVSVGFGVHVSPASTLVLYPHEDREVNPFNSAAELRASLDPARVPEKTLRPELRVEIKDGARDVVLFRGNAMWHLRERPANTVMLYFKMNAFHCDPLGEDPFTADFRERTQAALAAADGRLAELVPLLSRHIDYVHRRYNCLWQETLGVVLAGEKHFTIDEQEWQMLRAMDGERRLGDILDRTACAAEHPALLQKIRRLARRGVIDLVPAATSEPEIATRVEETPQLQAAAS